MLLQNDRPCQENESRAQQRWTFGETLFHDLKPSQSGYFKELDDIKSNEVDALELFHVRVRCHNTRRLQAGRGAMS
jgi:hypothetical protein